MTQIEKEEINVFDVTKTIINNYKQKLNEIDHYCINRILTILKVWDPDNWDINVSSGYYGEEIQSVELKYGIAADIEDQLNKILFDLKTTKEKIEALLILEYGYILQKIQNCNYRIETVAKNKIIFQREHYQKLDRAAIKAYEDYSLPVGIVFEDNNTHTLIDGYHRIAASKTDKIKVFVAQNSN